MAKLGDGWLSWETGGLVGGWAKLGDGCPSREMSVAKLEDGWLNRAIGG